MFRNHPRRVAVVTRISIVAIKSEPRVDDCLVISPMRAAAADLLIGFYPALLRLLPSETEMACSDVAWDSYIRSLAHRIPKSPFYLPKWKLKERSVLRITAPYAWKGKQHPSLRPHFSNATCILIARLDKGLGYYNQPLAAHLIKW